MSPDPLDRLEAVLVVGVGGFAGSNVRYLVELTVPSTLAATATVNVLGSFALGFLFYEGQFGDQISERGRLVLATGFLASFTTYSTFVLDALTAVPAVGLAYLLGSYALGFLGVITGRTLARALTSRLDGVRN